MDFLTLGTFCPLIMKLANLKYANFSRYIEQVLICHFKTFLIVHQVPFEWIPTVDPSISPCGAQTSSSNCKSFFILLDKLPFIFNTETRHFISGYASSASYITEHFSLDDSKYSVNEQFILETMSNYTEKILLKAIVSTRDILVFGLLDFGRCIFYGF